MTFTELDILKDYVKDLEREDLERLVFELFDLASEQELVMIGDDGSPRYFHTGEVIDGK